MGERGGRNLDDLLGRFASTTKTDDEDRRSRAIAEQQRLHRFRQSKRQVYMPRLKEAMAKLDSYGHLSRLTEPAADRVRLDVQLQARQPRRGTLELRLDAGGGRVGLAWSCGWTKRHQEEVALDKADAEWLDDRLVAFVGSLVEEAARG